MYSNPLIVVLMILFFGSPSLYAFTVPTMDEPDQAPAKQAIGARLILQTRSSELSSSQLSTVTSAIKNKLIKNGYLVYSPKHIKAAKARAQMRYVLNGDGQAAALNDLKREADFLLSIKVTASLPATHAGAQPVTTIASYQLHNTGSGLTIGSGQSQSKSRANIDYASGLAQSLRIVNHLLSKKIIRRLNQQSNPNDSAEKTVEIEVHGLHQYKKFKHLFTTINQHWQSKLVDYKSGLGTIIVKTKQPALLPKQLKKRIKRRIKILSEEAGKLSIRVY